MARFDLSAKGALGTVVLAAIVVCALFAPWLAPADPNAQDLMATMAPPAWAPGGSLDHPLGTDGLGQDILARIIWGARLSLVTALVAVTISAAFGTILGLCAGYFGKVVETLVMRLVDVVLAVPFILLALVIMSVLGTGVANLVIAFVAVRWTQYARLAYGSALDLKARDYVTACRTFGASHTRILLRHILPNCMGPAPRDCHLGGSVSWSSWSPGFPFLASAHRRKSPLGAACWGKDARPSTSPGG